MPRSEAGKHVMIEKPIEVSLEAADRIIAAERASGKTVAVVSQHRFDRSAEKVMAAIRGGRPRASGLRDRVALHGGGGNRITTQDGGAGPGRVTVAGRS